MNCGSLSTVSVNHTSSREESECKRVISLLISAVISKKSFKFPGSQCNNVMSHFKMQLRVSCDLTLLNWRA